MPQSDLDFDTLMKKFVPYVALNKVVLNVPTATSTALNGGFEDWTAGYADHQAKTTAALAATTVKNDAKAALTALAGPVIAQIQANPAVTDEQRLDMGLPIPDRTHTRAPVPTTRPVLRVESPEHLRHVLHWQDESKPKSKAKPKGVRGAQIRIHIGPNPPADPADFTWLALDSATPYLQAHDAADAGKMAYYALCWENTRGETGPWSDVIGATIPA